MAMPSPDPVAGPRYLLLADISGYTSFLNVEHVEDYPDVGEVHGRVVELDETSAAA
jgi:hypothetical protein